MSIHCDRITENTSGRTSVYLYSGYDGGFEDGDETGDVLRIDSSLEKRGVRGGRAVFDHAAQISLTPERAEAIVEALHRYLSDQKTKAHEALQAQRAQDEETATALVPGTVVDIADVPMHDRDTMHPDARLAGKRGVVYTQIFSGFNDCGVPAGRVVVALGLSLDEPRFMEDIHVSSLTVVTDDLDGFHDPAPTYAPASSFQVGDLVLVAAQASTTEDPEEGFVEPSVFGRAGQVVGQSLRHNVRVRVAGRAQYIHPAHLRNISAEVRANASNDRSGGVQ